MIPDLSLSNSDKPKPKTVQKDLTKNEVLNTTGPLEQLKTPERLP